MRALIQRVSHATVTVADQQVASIDHGILLLAGFHREETSDSFDYILNKTINARIFDDENDNMNISLKDIDGELLIVPQFTLYGDLRKGRRPSFSEAMSPSEAEKLFNHFIEKAKNMYTNTCFGIFGADMQVSLVNNGPVTLFLDSSRAF